LRIHDPSDVVIVALPLGLGVAISDVTSWLRPRERFARPQAIADQSARQVLQLLEVDRPITEIWPQLASSLLDELSFATCRYVGGPDTQLSIVADSHGRETDEQATFVLPAAGAAVPIHDAGRTVGFLVITPQPGHTSLTVRRSVVLAVAATVTSAIIAALGHADPPTAAANGSTTRSVR
jgi:hypothetical protein